jgi:predicted dehydrogenase
MIGYSFMGKAHSNAWRQVGRFFDLPVPVEMKRICGRNTSKVESARSRLGWRQACTDWREIIADPEIDVVDICTPNGTHAEIAIAAARAGKAILCEKPLARSLPEAEKMAAAVKRAKVVNMVCHNYRHVPAIALAKKMIVSGDLGDRIYHYHARYAQDWILDPTFPINWRLQSKFAGSGAHGDINAHIIDLARYLVGEIVEVCGLMETFILERPLADAPKERLDENPSKKMGKVTADDAVSWIGKFKNGGLANLEATRLAAGRKNQITLEINGSKGSLAFDFEDMNRLEYYTADDPPDRRGFRSILVTEPTHEYAKAFWPPGHLIGYEHTFIATFADFIKAVVDGKSVAPSFEDGLANQKVLAAIEKSAQTRRWIKV